MPRYRPLAVLARTPRATVLRAWDEELGREVALKRLEGSDTWSGEEHDRFLAEARLTARLQHPNIVPVYDLGRDRDGVAFYVMRLVEGETFRNVLASLARAGHGARGTPGATAPWTRARRLAAFLQICDAVAYAHARGVLHRDLKPENVMTGAFGEVLVMDWGIARALAARGASAPRPSPITPPPSSPAPPAPGALPAPGSPGGTHLLGPRDTLAPAPRAPTDTLAPRAPAPPSRAPTDTLAPPARPAGHSTGSAAAFAAEARSGPLPTPSSGTLVGDRVGTPGYMPPEQWYGELDVLSERSDVWSLGALLYELVTLRPAFPVGPDGSVPPPTLVPADPASLDLPEPVPAELGALCLAALDPRPERRPADARALGEALREHLDGARRREEARAHVLDARAAWEGWRGAAEALRTGEEALRTAAAAAEPWAPMAERAGLFALRRAQERTARERERAFLDVVAHAERALSRDPEHPEARRLLASAWWERFTEAEAQGLDADARFYAERVRFFDDGALAARLDAPARLRATWGPGVAEVRLHRWDRSGPAWTLDAGEALSGPVIDRTLALGSALLAVHDVRGGVVRHPFDARRGATLDLGELSPRPEALPPEVEWIPAGPARLGGDPLAGLPMPAGERVLPAFGLARFPVTVAEYLHFLDALDPAEAEARAPRLGNGLDQLGRPYWSRGPDGRWRLPERDPDGDPWRPDFPVLAVSWLDAVAYAAWRSRLEGRRWRLPTELEWEKAARGADGRCFPWGDEFDATLCKMGQSRPGRPQPEPVGAFTGDCSPYGVRDLAGGAREWCGDPSFDGDPRRRPMRGGCWNGSAKLCRAANRFGFEPTFVGGYVGFRLALDPD